MREVSLFFTLGWSAVSGREPRVNSKLLSVNLLDHPLKQYTSDCSLSSVTVSV